MAPGSQASSCQGDAEARATGIAKEMDAPEDIGGEPGCWGEVADRGGLGEVADRGGLACA